jgi:glutathione synthase/RimK-type ligase-like ATP-grasp enzyme
MVLVCGVEYESPTHLVIEALKNEHADFLVLDQEELAENVQLRWSLGEKGLSGMVRVGKEVVDIKDISGVFLRFLDPEDMPAAKEDKSLLTKTKSILFSLYDLFDILPANIVNRRRTMLSNFSKPYQAQLIRKTGFLIPRTLITNNPIEAKNFIEKNDGNVIYKSISFERSIVQEVSSDDINRLNEVCLLPTQFQEKIKGFNVRVHVVGKNTFATKIKASSVDYRYSHLEDSNVELEPYKLPESVANNCIRLTEDLGLCFSGIDLIIAEKQVYCLEVNTSPGYSYYELNTGQEISKSLARFLIGLHKYTI